MSTPPLSLRVSRRAIAAVTLKDEQLQFFDGRHLPSNRGRAVTAAIRYVARLIDQTGAKRVIVEAASHEGSQMVAVLDGIYKWLSERRLAATAVLITDVLYAFGVPGLRSRKELRQDAAGLFPQLNEMRSHVKPYLIDAAAVALFAETGTVLGVIIPP